jgi:hypothetical protein
MPVSPSLLKQSRIIITVRIKAVSLQIPKTTLAYIFELPAIRRKRQIAMLS